MEKCECCGKIRRGIKKVEVRLHLNNFRLCGVCAKELHVSKNILYSIMSKDVDWNSLLEHGKVMFAKGLFRR